MIGTSLKSPISGTRTSATPLGALVGAGGGICAGFTVGSRPGAVELRREDRRPAAGLRLSSPPATSQCLRMAKAPPWTYELQRYEWRFCFHAVADLHRDFNDRDVLEIPISGTATSLISPIPGISNYACSPGPRCCGHAAKSAFPRRRTLRIDAVFRDCFFHFLRRQPAIVGKTLECCNGDVVPIDFEEFSKRLAIIAAAEAVRAEANKASWHIGQICSANARM